MGIGSCSSPVPLLAPPPDSQNICHSPEQRQHTETVLIKPQIVQPLLFHYRTGVVNVPLEQPVAAQQDVQGWPSLCISRQE